jgi:hypothetical protein
MQVEGLKEVAPLQSVEHSREHRWLLRRDRPRAAHKKSGKLSLFVRLSTANWNMLISTGGSTAWTFRKI